MPSLSEEVSFIGGVNPDGTLPLYAFTAWNKDTPATYGGGYTNTAKWGATTAGTAGGTVNYYFDTASNWTTTEEAWLASGLALWSAVANISFALTTNVSQAQITFVRGSDSGADTTRNARYAPGAGVTGGSILGSLTSATISIDTSVAGFGPISTFSTYGGYPIMTFLHEEGHALGLGHAGPYNSTVDVTTQQFSAYDSRLWAIMSYINPAKTTAEYYADYPVKGTNWGYTSGYGNVPTTWMPLDILALQELYGKPTSTPLSGNQVFGFNCNINGMLGSFFNFSINTSPIITIWDAGSNNTLDLSGFSSASTVNLNPGTFSSCKGMVNNIAIAFDTAIDKLILGSGADVVTCNSDGDTIFCGSGNDTVVGGSGGDTVIGGLGDDTLDGGANVDTAVISGTRSANTLTQLSTGIWQVAGPDGTDFLSNIEYLTFDDQTVRLLPGQGSSVDWSAAPSTYMAAIRDFDGNDLGGTTGWKLIGTSDVNGDGSGEHILFNSSIGRWAEVATEADGKTYFSNYSWAGDTRVVGIYIDPLVTAGIVVKGSDNDSQRRFQNDLMIDNVHGILGQNDYNHDGLQEVYFSLTDGTAYLHAYMWADGNIQYANYQSKQQVIDYLTTNGWTPPTWASWFPAGISGSQPVSGQIAAPGNIYALPGKVALADSPFAVAS